MSHDPFDFDRGADPPLGFIQVTPTGEYQLPEAFRQRIGLYTPHDGGAIPRAYRFRPDGTPLVGVEELKRHYVEMRDWGAGLVAQHIASALALPGYASCRIARVLLDFNRFPGSTPASSTEPLEALAIGRLYSNVLNHGQKTALLEHYYDAISGALERILSDKLISIAIHTYDEEHASATKRADLSIISLPLSYQREARLTYGVFDPLFPDFLAESTCSRILRDRVSLNLERSGFRVSHNHPYPLPDGSIELRAQVWFFFRYLRADFEATHPETSDDPSYRRVWTMLLDTNLRLAEAEALRSFLHRFRKAIPEQRPALEAALEAYRHVRDHVQGTDVVDRYRRDPDRPSSLGIEVRKDLVCSFHPETGMPLPPTEKQRATAESIAESMAGAIATYIDTDRAFM